TATASAAPICANTSTSATSPKRRSPRPGIIRCIGSCAPARSRAPAAPARPPRTRTAAAAPRAMPFIAGGALPIRSTSSSTRESTCVSSRRECYRRTPGLRVRPVPELSTCVVFTPAAPQLFNLNPHAWLILELAPDRTYEELETCYLARVVPPLTDV